MVSHRFLWGKVFSFQKERVPLGSPASCDGDILIYMGLYGTLQFKVSKLEKIGVQPLFKSFSKKLELSSEPLKNL